MTERIEGVIETVAVWVELAGVVAIVAGGLWATVLFAAAARSADTRPGSYRDYRANLGRAILLGLELLVAGDIIATILVDASLESVASLAVIVVIRTFLSFSLETEIEGTPPWRRRADAAAGGGAGSSA